MDLSDTTPTKKTEVIKQDVFQTIDLEAAPPGTTKPSDEEDATVNSDETASTVNKAVATKKCTHLHKCSACTIVGIVTVVALVVAVVVLGQTSLWCGSGWKEAPKIFLLGTSDLPLASSARMRETYDTCKELEDDTGKLFDIMFAQQASRAARVRFYDSSLTCFACGPAIRGEMEPNSLAVSSSSVGAAVAEGDSYLTNNQVVDAIDESDIVQSNGEFAFALYGRELIKLDADAVTLLNRTTVDECVQAVPAGLVLHQDRLVVFVTASSTCSVVEMGRNGLDTKVIVYSVGDMEIVDSFWTNGFFLTARLVDGNVHLVTSKYITVLYDSLADPGFDLYKYNDEATLRSELEKKYQEMRGDLVKTALEGLTCQEVQKITLFQGTNDILATAAGSQLSFASVTSFSLADPTATQTQRTMAVPSYGWKAYASSEQLVLAVPGPTFDNTTNTTWYDSFIMAYKLDGPQITAQGMGVVPGYVLNEFSVHHEKKNGEDLLYVATTNHQINDDFNLDTNSSSQVSVLSLDNDTNDTIPVIGQVGDLGKPMEEIHSVRFQGDRAFVVTFMYTDPFYAIDLADPRNPKKAGELEMLGFSNYLHPIGDDLILGVGQMATDQGVEQGFMISLFDVSDLSNPVMLHSYTEEHSENLRSVSEAQHEHRAFRYFPDKQLLIVPLTVDDYGYSDNNFDGFRVYKIDRDAGIDPYMSIAHSRDDFHHGCWSPSAFLGSRSFVFDHDVMTFRGHSILSYDLDTKQPDADPIHLDDGMEDCSNEYFPPHIEVNV